MKKPPPIGPRTEITNIISEYKIIPDAVCPHCGGRITLTKGVPYEGPQEKRVIRIKPEGEGG